MGRHFLLESLNSQMFLLKKKSYLLASSDKEIIKIKNYNEFALTLFCCLPLMLPFSIAKGTNLTGLQPSYNTMVMESVL